MFQQPPAESGDVMNKLTVLIPCKNERSNIGACIESAGEIADEVLVADSGSTDGTLEIAASYGARIIEREYVHSGDFKNWAIPQASNEWILLLDADERVTDELRAEIVATLEAPDCDGYWIYRANHFMGHRIRFSGWQNDRVIRLFRRDVSRYEGDTDHAEVRVETGRVGKLKSRLTHYTYWTYDQFLAKMHRYTTHQAKMWHERGKRPSAFRMLTTIPLRFVQTYFLRLGFRDGLAGLQVCALTAYYSFMKQARLWELYSALAPPDEEQPVVEESRAA